MIESKLIKNIAQLSSRNRQQFKVFVTSPYFNQHKKTIDLLNYILKHIDKKVNKLERQLTFSYLFPKEPYSEQLLFNTMSSLKKLFHRFLAQQQYEQEHFQEDIYLLEATYQDNLFELLLNRAKNFNRKLNKYAYKDSDYYYSHYQYLNTIAYYTYHHKDRSNTKLLQALNDNLDRYYMLEKLKHCCELTANQILMNSQYDYSLLDEVLSFYEKRRDDFAEDYSIQLYHTALLSMQHPETPAHYAHLKQMLKEEFHHFSPSERSSLYSYTNNYCIRQINKGDSSFQKELFELYKEGLSSELIFTNGLLNEWNYKNITALGCKLEEFEWTVYFLDTYKERLPKSKQENSYNYNMAHLNFSRQQYDEALDHLLLVRFSDVKYHLSHNNLLLATHYALGDIEASLSLIEAYRIYIIRNKKMTVDQKKQYTNFLRFAKKLAIIKQEPRTYGGKSKSEKFAQLYLAIQQSKNIVNRYWLEKTCKEEAGATIDALLAQQ